MESLIARRTRSFRCPCFPVLYRAEGKGVIIVEGILIFTDPDLRNLLDVKVFVDTVRRRKRERERKRLYLGLLFPVILTLVFFFLAADERVGGV